MFKVRYKSHHDVGAVISASIKGEKAEKEDFIRVLNSKNESRQLGLYFHTPYCDKICSFCNMNRKQLDNDLEEYTAYLCSEIKKYGTYNFVKTSKVDVVFFGGGTPTIYREEQLERILKSLKENFIFADNCEITFETTLHNLTIQKIEIFNKYGVNRISIGIQTFSDRGRKYLNRSYSKEYAIKRLKEIKEKFKGLICVDIIYNYPNQTNEEILEDIEILSDMAMSSASFYSLMVQKGSEISKNKDDKDSFVYSLERDEELHKLFYEKALEKNYKLLEFTKITNKEKVDEYRYIRNNNAQKNLLPLGLGAGGKVAGISCYNFNKNMSFYSKISEAQRKLSMISGMMQFAEFDLNEFKKYCSSEFFHKALEKFKFLEKEGYIEINNNIVLYTSKGIFWGNSISVEIIKILLEEYNKREEEDLCQY